MKGIVFILVLLPVTLQAQDYTVKKRCSGNGSNAMVVEYKDQYFVVKTPRYFQHDWTIHRLAGLMTGGYHTLNYTDGSGQRYQMEVYILSRMGWNYSGYPAATTICRRITQPGYRKL